MAESFGEIEAGGGLRVLYGTPSGLTSTGAAGGLDQEITRDTPGVPGEQNDYGGWGTTLAVADFDGDGCTDVAVGVPHEAGTGATPRDGRIYTGAVHVLYGSRSGLRAGGLDVLRQSAPAGTPPHDATVVVPDVQEAGDQFGSALAAGDFDGDGLADLAIAAQRDAPGPNKVPVNEYDPPRAGGKVDEVITVDGRCPSGASCLPPGPRMGPAPDVGTVTVVYGSKGGLGRGDRPARTFTHAGLGGNPDDRYVFGWALAAGDFDGDGADDLVASARPAEIEAPDAHGVVHVLSGKRGAGLGHRGPQTFSRATRGVPGDAADGLVGIAMDTGDLDGNGTDDLAIAGGRGPRALLPPRQRALGPGRAEVDACVGRRRQRRRLRHGAGDRPVRRAGPRRGPGRRLPRDRSLRPRRRAVRRGRPTAPPQARRRRDLALLGPRRAGRPGRRTTTC